MNTRQSAPRVLTLVSCLSSSVACTHNREPVPPPPVPSQEECPEGFGPLAIDPAEGLEDGCYRIDEPADWIDGEDACEAFESEGIAAHLVVVDREAEHEVLSTMVGGAADGRIWTAMFQRDPEDDYRNVNYVEWDREFYGPGEPNDYAEDCDFLGSCYPAPGEGDERCIDYNAETSLWNDENCFRVVTVICEWDGVEPLGWRPYRDQDD